jgi:ATP synthase protein I
MSIMALDPVRRGGFDADEPEDQDFKRLTSYEAQVLREHEPALSPWWVVGLQCVAGVAVVLVAWGVSGKASVAWSAGYGSLAVIIPAALFARGLMSQFSSLNAATASFGFFVWEAVKMAVSVAMIVLAPRLIADLSWPALLVGLFVTLKMYWFALLKRPKPKQI